MRTTTAQLAAMAPSPPAAFFRCALSRALNVVRLADKPAHRRRVAASRRVLRTLRQFRGEGAAGRAFAYLRTIDPLVFEEAVLSALESAGAVVLRNRRYSRDGGIDGRCWLPGQGFRTVAVQVKRYGAAITPSHAADFCERVRSHGHAAGLFVHCGRTGQLSYAALRGGPVELCSGSRLLNLLLRGRLDPRVATMPAAWV